MQLKEEMLKIKEEMLVIKDVNRGLS